MSEKIITLRTRCHPEANGRKPIAGETQWAMIFPLESGEILQIKMGKEGFETIGQFILDSMADTPSYGDGSLDHVRKELES
jgi:hypothetical protein